jgi:molybdopterin-guanine dinucleotide biosynthesis protein A
MRSAVILAGGSGRRLGAEKALLDFKGRPLVCWTAERLLEMAEELVIVARNEDQAARLQEILPQAEVTWDAVLGFGPVAGLAAGMKRTRGRLAFAAGCDMPFLNLKVIQLLFELAEGFEAAVPAGPKGTEPLHAVYKAEKMALACQKALERGERKIQSPLRELRSNFVPVERLKELDPELLTFFNLNTREELQEAEKIWPIGSASAEGRSHRR